MKLAEVDNLQPLERIDRQSDLNLSDPGRVPFILTGAHSEMEFLRRWDLDFFSGLKSEVQAQQPEPDGINYFLDFQMMPFGEFITKIKAGEQYYIGALELMGGGGKPSEIEDLAMLCDMLDIPPWVSKSSLAAAYLWVGHGLNRTLLHFDPWDNYLMLGSGEKRFTIFPSDATKFLHPYSVFDAKGRVMHSQVNPLDIQSEYVEGIQSASGYQATLKPGEIIYIPAGFWHYVESFGVNIGVSFFTNLSDKKLFLKRPLIDWWFKRNIIGTPIRLYRPVRSWLSKNVKTILRIPTS